MIKINAVPIIASIVPIQAPLVGIFFVNIHIKNKIIIGLVEDNVATIPASAFWSAINNKLIPRAIPRNPLIIDLIIIEELIGTLETKLSVFKKKLQLNNKQEIVVLIAAEAIGSTPEFNIGFIIIDPIAWHKAANIPKIIPAFIDPSIISHLWSLFLFLP